MELDRNYSKSGRRCIYRPAGAATSEELAHAIADVLSYARSQRLHEALIDITAIHGFDSPSPAFRQWAVNIWAQAVGHNLRLALVARPEHICPQRTGLLAAADEGLHAGIFDNIPDAIAWLDAAML